MALYSILLFRPICKSKIMRKVRGNLSWIIYLIWAKCTKGSPQFPIWMDGLGVNSNKGIFDSRISHSSLNSPVLQMSIWGTWPPNCHVLKSHNIIQESGFWDGYQLTRVAKLFIGKATIPCMHTAHPNSKLYKNRK